MEVAGIPNPNSFICLEVLVEVLKEASSLSFRCLELEIKTGAFVAGNTLRYGDSNERIGQRAQGLSLFARRSRLITATSGPVGSRQAPAPNNILQPDATTPPYCASGR